MKKYEEIETVSGNFIIQCKDEDGSVVFIPKDESNSDYQAYLESLNNA